MKTCYFQTPVGIAKICGNASGVAEISIASQEVACSEVPIELEICVQQLREYFDGSRQVFDFVINQKGTDFQQKVWSELCNVPFGKTISYLHLAKKLGDPKVIRAAASANGKNRLWIVVPCHRVIGTDGSLTGYAGGLWRKKWLLEHENPSLQQVLF